MNKQFPSYIELAVRFAQALVSGDFVQAHSMLGTELSGSVFPDHLRQDYKAMIDYGDGPVTDVELMESSDDWPDKQLHDLGWAYVAMAGDGFSEAVAVIVAQESQGLVIRDITWGRP